MKVARIYLRVSTGGQDLARQERIKADAEAAGHYVAGVYGETASGARADRPELLRMIDSGLCLVWKRLYRPAFNRP